MGHWYAATMDGKSDLSTLDVQNVVVYVSTDNFTQTYSVGQRNVQAAVGSKTSPYTLASMGMSSKHCIQKQLEHYNNGVQHVTSQKGYLYPVVHNSSYQNHNTEALNISQVKHLQVDELIVSEKQPGFGRQCYKLKSDHDAHEGYNETGYVNVMGGESLSHSVVRCDSVRSEAAESSCSSVSSVDETLIVTHPSTPDMVVYDASANVQPPGVVLAVGAQRAPHTQQAAVTHQSSVGIPCGWKRLANNGEIIYIR